MMSADLIESATLEQTNNLEKHTAHVLFLDIVGYSIMSIPEQKIMLAQLQHDVRSSPEFGSRLREDNGKRFLPENGDLIARATGDGMALAFFTDTCESAVKCAEQITERIRPHAIPLRMGINSGTVVRIRDINGEENIAGGGINMAQRVMDCGDQGHILLSSSVGENDCLTEDSKWKDNIGYFGEVKVKHNKCVRLYNYYDEQRDIGNKEVPEKVQEARHRKLKVTLLKIGFAIAFVMAIVAFVFVLYLLKRPRPAPKSLVILPFTNETNDLDNEYLSNGIAEGIYQKLYKNSDLNLMSYEAGKQRLRQYKKDHEGQPIKAQDIASAFGVEAALIGSFKIDGDGLSVQTELGYAGERASFWNNKFLSKFLNIQEIQSGIVEGLSNRLPIELNKSVASNYAPDPEAYRFYLKGRYHLDEKTPPDGYQQAAITNFQQAYEKDKKFSLPLTGLADYYITQGGIRITPKNAREVAGEYAEKAIKASTEPVAEAHASLGMLYYWYDHNWEAAEIEFGKAIACNYRYLPARRWYSAFLTAMGRFPEAYEQIRQAQQFNSDSPILNTTLVQYYYFKNDGESIRLIEANPQLTAFPAAQRFLAQIYEQQGFYPKAIQLLEGLRKSPSPSVANDPDIIAALGHAYAISGRSQEATEMIAVLERLEYVPPFDLALIYAGLAQGAGSEKESRDYKGKAIQALKKGLNDNINGQDVRMAWLKIEPRFKILSSDDEFKQMIEQLKFPRPVF